jgi:bla regulator protein BlaR1
VILAWMLYAIVVACAAGAAAHALEGAARALGRPTRFAWVMALFVSAGWPLWRLASHVLLSSSDRVGEAVLLPQVVVTTGRGVAATIADMLPAAISVVLVAGWGLATTVLLARLLLGMRAVSRQRSAWRAREIDGVPTLVSVDTGPAVVGVRRPMIVLPEWVLALEPGLMRLVLRHEMEHVRAVDTAPRLLGALVTALVPWNPVLWWQASRLSLAIEADCDVRVLRADPRRERYGLLLLAMAQRQSGAMLAPALSEPTSHLERRIRIMHRSAPRRPVLLSAGLATLAGLALMLACSTPTPTPDAALSPTRGPSAESSPDGKFFEFKVTKQAARVAGNEAPHYPDALRAAGTEGKVLAQFVVGSDGTVDLASYKVLESTDPAFVKAVREVLPTWRYKPAEVSGRAVRQLVTEPFVFQLEK